MNAEVVWIGKALCLASRYALFDYFQDILQDLRARMHFECEPYTIVEQHIF